MPKCVMDVSCELSIANAISLFIHLLRKVKYDSIKILMHEDKTDTDHICIFKI